MKHLKTTRHLLAVALLLFVFASVNSNAQDTIWYVNKAVAASGDGTTPATAFKTLAEAIGTEEDPGPPVVPGTGAGGNTATSDTILIAAGTYTNADIPETIDIESSMTLSGSWNATFTTQDFEATPTIIDLNSQVQFIHAVNVDAWAVDNMIIRESSSTEDGNTDDGGAMRIQNGGPCTITNVIFDSCSALFEEGGGVGPARSGGALMIRSGTQLVLEDCIFRNNFSVTRGGAVFMRSGGGNILDARRCLFVGNKAPNGAIVHTDGGESGSTITLTNSIFRANFGTNAEFVGAPSDMFGPLTARYIGFRNCTFVGNNSEAHLLNIGNGLGDGRVLELTNNIFLDNQFADRFINLATPEDWETSNTLLVQYNLLDGNAAEPLDFADASFVGVNNNFLGTAALINPSADNYTPLESSDAIDAGLTLADVLDDFEGDSRPQGAGYDIGAIEGAFDPSVTRVNHWTIY